MRNDNARWQPAEGLERPAFTTSTFALRLVRPRRQTLISGPHASALALAGVAGATGWPGPAMAETYALRLRRDRILVVNGPELADGWHAQEGLAVSDMTDGYAVLEMSGTDAMSILRRGTEIALNEPSASAARGFAGYSTLIYSCGAQNRYRVHVPRGDLEGLWALLLSFAEQVDT